MGTKLLIYVIMVDVLLAMLTGAYSGISAPSIPAVPTQAQAVAIVSFTWTVGWGSFTLIPSFTLLPQIGPLFFPGGPTVGPVVTPAVVIPGVTLFSVSFSWLWPVILVFLYIAWIFLTIGTTVAYIVTIFASAITLMTSVPVVGPFLTAVLVIMNFVLIWEVVKLIRGYGP